MNTALSCVFELNLSAQGEKKGATLIVWTAMAGSLQALCERSLQSGVADNEGI